MAMKIDELKVKEAVNEFMKPVQVRMCSINLNDEFITDIESGKGFLVTESAYTRKTEKTSVDGRPKGKKYVKNPNGIMSQKFCTDYGDEGAFKERFSCECKEIQGKKRDGEICPACNTICEFKDVDYEMTGWIELNGKYIIAPGFYELMKSLIGKVLPDIYDCKKIVGLDGEIEIEGAPSGKTQPFYGIGLSAMRERFREIIAFYVKRNKDKAKLGAYLLANEAAVFIHAVPVYNAVLRPEVFEYNTYSYYDINTIYKSVFNKAALLADDPLLLSKLNVVAYDTICQDLSNEQILSQIQELVVRLDEGITKILKGKEGFIQQNIKGGRMDWTARAVIVSDMTLRANEIKIPYVAALELYKFQIIGYISEIADISYAKAYRQWHRATLKFDAKVYGIIQYMIKKVGLSLIINRNPTINYGSMMMLDVIDVSTDINDLTLKMSFAVLTAYNADFDGDQLNMYAMTTESFKKEFGRIFNPIYNMFISRMTGEFDKAFDLLKDQAISLYDWNSI